jgi:hypothetical protein
LICVAASQEPLDIPDSLLETTIIPTKPTSTLADSHLDHLFRYKLILFISNLFLSPNDTKPINKRKLRELSAPESHTEERKQKKSRRSSSELPSLDVVDPGSSYVPNFSYFHCISSKKAENKYEL